MSEYANSKVRVKVWVTPDQVEAFRSACYTTSVEYLQQCNEATATATYGTELRVGELARVDAEFLRNDNLELYLPTEVQKDYPNEHSLSPVTLECSNDITRLLSSYLTNRRGDTLALFPSCSPDRISK